MNKAGTPRHDPIAIGEIAEPPFVRLPDPSVLFSMRAARFRAVAEGHQLGPYLRFLAALSDCQDRVQDGLPNRTCRLPRCARKARSRHAAARPQPLHRRCRARRHPQLVAFAGRGDRDAG